MDAPAQVGEKGAIADNMGETVRRVLTKATAGEVRPIVRVHYRLVVPVPTEVPDVSGFTAPTNSTPVVEIPAPRRQPSGGALPDEGEHASHLCE